MMHDAVPSILPADETNCDDFKAVFEARSAFARIQRADAARWAPAVRDSGFTGEQ